jgi:hypothetical protein
MVMGSKETAQNIHPLRCTDHITMGQQLQSTPEYTEKNMRLIKGLIKHSLLMESTRLQR